MRYNRKDLLTEGVKRLFKNVALSIRSKIIIGYMIIVVCLGISLVLLNNRIVDVQNEINYIVEHDMEVHNLINQTEKNLLDMETGMRGFDISGETRYLEPYQAGKARWEHDYNRLNQLLDNNPTQQKNLEAIRTAIVQWIEKNGEYTISLKQQNKMEQVYDNFKMDLGKNYMDQLRAQVDSFRATEKALTESRAAQLDEKNKMLRDQLYLLLFLVTIVSILVAMMISGTIVRTIKDVSRTIREIASSEGAISTRRIELRTKDEMRSLGEATNELLDSHSKSNWLQTSLVEVSNMYQHMNNINELSQSFITQLASILNASQGVFYLRTNYRNHSKLLKIAAYADQMDDVGVASIHFGEGLVGQCAKENRIFHLNDIPDTYVKVSSALGQSSPRSIVIVPIVFENKVEAVIELASLEPFTPIQIKLLEQIRSTYGIAINNVTSRMEVERLLEESQAMTEELQQQSEELQAQTEELQTQSEELLAQQDELRTSNESLKQSEEYLQRQQQELEQSNQKLFKKGEELEDRIRYSEEVSERIEQQNMALEATAEELAAVSKYKSEFLANMSHELRTPLNSLLILSQLLAENKDMNMTSKQVEFAHTINSSGNDLLRLIDEILDLSKVEAGKMELELDLLRLDELKDTMWRTFQPMTVKKHVNFDIQIDSSVPETLLTDGHRLQQVLKNLLSNAIKFTSHGEISLQINRTTRKLSAKGSTVNVICFSVTDTGIGIPKEKRSMIFEAFQQVDGTTNRKFGGTGLGLTISREIASLLGGQITVDSEEGKGSTFTLYLPEVPVANQLHSDEVAVTENYSDRARKDVLIPRVDISSPELLKSSEVADDRDSLEPGDKVILVIEDDMNFARIIKELAQSRGFKVLVGLQGDTGLALAHTYKPDAIILDIQLPVIDGWGILDNLKKHPDTRHIPVHVMSVVDDSQQGLSMGAMAYLKKPTDRESIEKAFIHIEDLINRTLKRLLIVEDDLVLRDSLVQLIDHDDVIITAVSTGEETLQELASNHFDCMVMDLGLADMSGFDLLDRIRQTENYRTLPIIIYTGKELDTKQEMELKKYAESIIIKNVKSQERLYDETALFLHRVEANLPEDRRTMLKKLHQNESAFNGKHILLVEDDIRNVFALSNVLEDQNLKLTYAENGREALEILDKNPDFDLILMDIMMPEMDGYEAMRQIRSQHRFEKLPIIALTAKAMKEDREKCIAAGASDYISKPINMDRLFSLLKVWLYK
ncbi:Autoinducer 2 sensor kinase/phosphatase LuxQ [compost metagenome]